VIVFVYFSKIFKNLQKYWKFLCKLFRV
jgi:hypothetical protein